MATIPPPDTVAVMPVATAPAAPPVVNNINVSAGNPDAGPNWWHAFGERGPTFKSHPDGDGKHFSNHWKSFTAGHGQWKNDDHSHGLKSIEDQWRSGYGSKSREDQWHSSRGDPKGWKTNKAQWKAEKEHADEEQWKRDKDEGKSPLWWRRPDTS